ncbi:MAG: hypothetical protein ACYS47_01035 [Planctomycetota bacterium]|jgi:hypothetical protein
MKRFARFSAFGIGSLGFVLFLAYSVLSASSVVSDPLASYEDLTWSPTAGILEENPVPAPRESWVEAVRDVLVRIEEMESRLEVYSGELEAIEKEEEADRMAEVLELDARSPARALETLLNRFKDAVEAYEGLNDADKATFVDMEGSSQVEALKDVSATEDEFNAYLDRLAVRRKAYVAAEARREDASRIASAAVTAEEPAKAQKAAEAKEEPKNTPASNKEAAPEKQDPTPKKTQGK